MEAVDSRIISIMDRLAHASTTDQDALNSVYGLRRVVKGAAPSTLLRTTPTQPKQKEITHLKKLVERLRTELVEQADANDELMEEKLVLEQQLHNYKSRPNKSPRGCTDPYSYNDVMEIIRNKFGKQNGALTLWVNHSTRLQGENCVTVSVLTTWRRNNSYPAWAVEQLLGMPVGVPKPHKWSPEDIDYLCNLHLADPFKCDDQLAAECSLRFDCVINTNSIKSKFNLLRKLGRIDAQRPSR